MFNIDPFMRAGLIAFFIPTVLGCLAYLVATLLAHFVSSNPRHIYIGRLVCLAVFLVLITIYCNPDYVFSGSGDRRLLFDVKLEGREYGTLTVNVWVIVALLNRPKSQHENAT